MNRTDLQKLATTRLREAQVLFEAGEYSGAYYLAGYAVECALKACIAKETQRFEFPDKSRVNKSHVHRASDLMEVANLDAVFRAARQSNPRLQASWNVVNNWSEQTRYQTWVQADAHAMIVAVGRRRDGVLSWIKLHW
jgi:hypothetical protein